MTISLEVKGEVAQISLDDGKANAIDPAWQNRFIEVFDDAERSAKAIVIAGRPGVFSGGYNLKWMPTANAEELSSLLHTGGELICRVFGSPRPVIAACTGHAIAMGFFVLLACDTRIGSKGDFKFGANETINGMKLPVFASEIGKARLDPTKLTLLVTQAYMFGPEEAVRFGALDQVEEADRVLDTAMGVAEQLAQLPGEAYAFNKLAWRQPTIDRIRSTTGGY